jgi:hypothetical protein
MVKPVDLQDNLSKTQLLEKVHQLQKSIPEEAQKQFAQELQKKTIDNKNKVADLPKADEIIIHKDEKRKKNGRKSGRESRKNDKEKSQDESDSQPRKIDYIA